MLLAPKGFGMTDNVHHYHVACHKSLTRLESWLLQTGMEQDRRHLAQLSGSIRYYQDLLSQNDLSLSDLRLVYLDLLDLYLWAIEGFSTKMNLKMPRQRPLRRPHSLTEAA